MVKKDMVIRERLNCGCRANVVTRVKACHMCMQFVQWTAHWFLGAAQIVCAYGVPSLFDLAGHFQHAEVRSRHRSMQFVQRTQWRFLFNCTNCMLLCRASTLRHDVNDMTRKCTWSVGVIQGLRLGKCLMRRGVLNLLGLQVSLLQSPFSSFVLTSYTLA